MLDLIPTMLHIGCLIVKRVQEELKTNQIGIVDSRE